MNADRLFMLVDTCANIDEVKHEFPDLDFLTYFYALLGYYCIPTIKLYNETKIDENTTNIVIEVATFDGANLRETARRLNS